MVGQLGKAGLSIAEAWQVRGVLELDLLTTDNVLKKDRILYDDSRMQRMHWRFTQARGQWKALQTFTDHVAWSILINFDMRFDAPKSTSQHTGYFIAFKNRSLDFDMRLPNASVVISSNLQTPLQCNAQNTNTHTSALQHHIRKQVYAHSHCANTHHLALRSARTRPRHVPFSPILITVSHAVPSASLVLVMCSFFLVSRMILPEGV